MEARELVEIKGGISAATVNAVIRAINLAFELGKTIGSAIKRKLTGKYVC